jgi:hypothetical protein
LKYFDQMDDFAIRQLIDSNTIYQELGRACGEGDEARSRSLKSAMEQACRLNKALRIGRAPTTLLRALHESERGLQLRGLWPLHLYSTMAGVWFKPAALPRRNSEVQLGADTLGSVEGIVISSFGRIERARAPAPADFARQFSGTPSGEAIAELLSQGLIDPGPREKRE